MREALVGLLCTVLLALVLGRLLLLVGLGGLGGLNLLVAGLSALSLNSFGRLPHRHISLGRLSTVPGLSLGGLFSRRAGLWDGLRGGDRLRDRLCNLDLGSLVSHGDGVG